MHTPGPWYADGSTILKDIKGTQRAIAEVFNWSEETESNAILMSAAPELLSALKKVISYVDANDQSKPGVIEAIKVIWKAEGK